MEKFSLSQAENFIVKILQNMLNFKDQRSLVELKSDYETSESIPLDDLIAHYAERSDMHVKAQAVSSSVSGITSVLSSSTLIWMIFRSHKGTSTIQHRLLLGLCISDILSSLGHSTFNTMAPSDVNYFVWNAIGNQTTCNLQGFIIAMGTYCGLFYNTSLNIYYLAAIKHEKNEAYIRSKIEPFLHGVPIVTAFTFSITMLVKKHFNNDGLGNCILPAYYAPHCNGEYDEEELHNAGFKIPCGRGSQGSYIALISIVILMVVPIFMMITSLGLIYKAVRKVERELEKYRPSLPDTRNLSTWSSLRSSMRSMASSIRWGKSAPAQNSIVIRSNNSRSKSRAVMHKALCYTVGWLVSFGLFVINMIMNLSGKSAPLSLTYIINVFGPLQGFFNFIIFMLPKVKNAKKSKRGEEKVTWRQAISKAFWSRGNVSKNKSKRHRDRRSNTAKNHKLARTGNKKSSHIDHRTMKLRPQKENQEEEEKCEIKVPDDTNTMLDSNIKSFTCASNVPNESTEMKSFVG